MTYDIGDFCYAVASGAAEAMVLYGQALIIGLGLIVGLLGAVLYRRRTKDRRYKA